MTSVTRCLDVSYCEPSVVPVCSNSFSNRTVWTAESKMYYGHDPCECGLFASFCHLPSLKSSGRLLLCSTLHVIFVELTCLFIPEIYSQKRIDVLTQLLGSGHWQPFYSQYCQLLGNRYCRGNHSCHTGCGWMLLWYMASNCAVVAIWPRRCLTLSTRALWKVEWQFVQSSLMQVMMWCSGCLTLEEDHDTIHVRVTVGVFS